uniref:Methyltransferase n=1 Tax=viral metagenome TaxID=1070528 RepID=A0A6C0ANA1_9ZZZZ
MTEQKQDTGKFRQNTKDQFYTKTSIAKECIDSILSKYPEASKYMWIEPSAGNGSFLNLIPRTIQSIGMDIDPRAPNIQKLDFLKWLSITDGEKVYFGNPPFGSQGSLAKSFIKHAVTNNAKVIAFILPRSFMKPSMNSAFPLKFHCIHEKELPKDSFEVNKVSYDVPCVFQIWVKMDENRELDEKVEPFGFKYVKSTEIYHMAFRRVGVNAGTCYLKDTIEKSPQSHYFLSFDGEYLPRLAHIKEQINNHTFPSNTVGPRSLSKSETNTVINSILLRLTA